ncbi:MAG: topology modulation protein [Rhodobiaceae bacterium]|nr:topology modulation protein [Rhodobiaceae bacterium]
MKRVLVIGCSGAGKSTLAKAIADRTSLPLIHLDNEFWHPGWVETPADEWPSIVEQLAARGSWVMDGNYSGTFPYRMPRADTIILVERPRWLCLLRAMWRSAKFYGRVRPDLAEGCPERFSLDFYKWIWDFPNRSKKKMGEAMATIGAHATQITLASDREAHAFLETIDPKTD